MLKRITDHILYLPADPETDRPVLAAIFGTRKTLIVDAGNSPRHARLFLDALSGYRIPPPAFVALTHWHWDHVFGLAEMNLPALAQVGTAKKMEEMAGFDWSDEALNRRVAEGTEIPFCAEMIKKEFPVGRRKEIRLVKPDILFKDWLLIDLGGITCILENIGGDHSKDSSIIFVPEEGTIFLGDCLGPDLYSGKWKYRADNLILLAERLAAYDARIFVESHAEPAERGSLLKDLEELKSFARIIKMGLTSRRDMVKALEAELGRNLGREDFETLGYFLNGFDK